MIATPCPLQRMLDRVRAVLYQRGDDDLTIEDLASIEALVLAYARGSDGAPS